MGAVAKMPVELRMTYGAMYDGLSFQDRFLFMMRDNWVDLRKRLLSRTLTEKDRQDLLGDVQQIREINSYFAGSRPSTPNVRFFDRSQRWLAPTRSLRTGAAGRIGRRLTSAACLRCRQEGRVRRSK